MAVPFLLLSDSIAWGAPKESEGKLAVLEGKSRDLENFSLNDGPYEVVRIENELGQFQYWAVVTGAFDRKDWTLTVAGEPVTLDTDRKGAFSAEVPLKEYKGRGTFKFIDPRGEITELTVQVSVPDQEITKLGYRKIWKKRAWIGLAEAKIDEALSIGSTGILLEPSAFLHGEVSYRKALNVGDVAWQYGAEGFIGYSLAYQSVAFTLPWMIAFELSSYHRWEWTFRDVPFRISPLIRIEEHSYSAITPNQQAATAFGSSYSAFQARVVYGSWLRLGAQFDFDFKGFELECRPTLAGSPYTKSVPTNLSAQGTHWGLAGDLNLKARLPGRKWFAVSNLGYEGLWGSFFVGNAQLEVGAGWTF